MNSHKTRLFVGAIAFQFLLSSALATNPTNTRDLGLDDNLPPIGTSLLGAFGLTAITGMLYDDYMKGKMRPVQSAIDSNEAKAMAIESKYTHEFQYGKYKSLPESEGANAVRFYLEQTRWGADGNGPAEKYVADNFKDAVKIWENFTPHSYRYAFYVSKMSEADTKEVSRLRALSATYLEKLAQLEKIDLKRGGALARATIAAAAATIIWGMYMFSRELGRAGN